MSVRSSRSRKSTVLLNPRSPDTDVPGTTNDERSPFTELSERVRGGEASGGEAETISWRLGRALYCIACAGLGLTEIAFGDPLAPLHPWDGAPAGVSYASGATLLLAAAWLMFRPSDRIAALVLALHWSVALAFTINAALAQPGNALNWVPVLEAGLFATAAVTLYQPAAGAWDRILQLAFGLTLYFFGLVHLVRPDLIAALIPAWVPWSGTWPWLTGSTMLLAGLALTLGAFVRPAAATIALMFSSWIALLHVERLAGDVGSSFEWTFALTALTLTGVAALVSTDRTHLRRTGANRPFVG